MDNFTLAVVIGSAAMILAFIALIALDRKTPARTQTIEAVKPAGKR